MAYKHIDYVKAHRKIAPFTSQLIARTLVEADRMLEHHKKFIKRIKDAEASSIQRFNALPTNATIRKEYVKCGKNDCEMSHGPYFYAYWKEKTSTCNNKSATVWKLKKKYIGSYLPEIKPSELVANSYIGTINGIDVTKELMIDPTNSTKDVVHFMIPKPVVMQIAEQVNKSGQAKEGLMKFMFKPTL